MHNICNNGIMQNLDETFYQPDAILIHLGSLQGYKSSTTFSLQKHNFKEGLAPQETHLIHQSENP